MVGKKPKSVAGFTLIEVMVVVGVVAILAAIAWPLFESQIIKQTRSDAVHALMLANQNIKQCKTDNATYAGCTLPLNLQTSPEGYYSITFTEDGASFGLTATKNNATDTECTALTLDSVGRKGYTGSAPNARRCWGD